MPSPESPEERRVRLSELPAERLVRLYREAVGRDPSPPADHPLAWQWEWRGTPEERAALAAELQGPPPDEEGQLALA